MHTKYKRYYCVEIQKAYTMLNKNITPTESVSLQLRLFKFCRVLSHPSILGDVNISVSGKCE